jgi:hypothetical protein
VAETTNLDTSEGGDVNRDLGFGVDRLIRRRIDIRSGPAPSDQPGVAGTTIVAETLVDGSRHGHGGRIGAMPMAIELIDPILEPDQGRSSPPPDATFIMHFEYPPFFKNRR